MLQRCNDVPCCCYPSPLHSPVVALLPGQQGAKKAQRSRKATGRHTDLDGGVTVLPKAGGAAAAKGKRKAPAGDAAGGTRKKHAAPAKTVCIITSHLLVLSLLSEAIQALRCAIPGCRACVYVIIWSAHAKR